MNDEQKEALREFLSLRLRKYTEDSESGDPAIAVNAREEYQHFALLSALFELLDNEPSNDFANDIDNLTKAVAELTERLVSLETATPPTIPPDLSSAMFELAEKVNGVVDRVTTLETAPTPKAAKS